MAFDLTKLQKSVVGTNPQKGAMIFQTGAPLDDRFVVRDKAALISQSAFTSIGYLYQGLVCTDRSTGDTYILTDAPSTSNNFLKADTWFTSKTDADIVSEIEKHWKKLAFIADINSSLNQLSGVFQFKGVAEAVSPDLSYIVVCTPSMDGSNISPIGTFSDLEGEIYYGWKDKNATIFYTDSLVLNDLTKQYERGSDTYDMRSLEYNGDMYYLTTASPIDDDDTQAYENVSGEMIYLDNGYLGFTNGGQVQVTDQEGTVLGTAIGHVYNAYTFTEVTEPASITHSHIIITASSDNSGHVYQIEENEYASNGQIWVKLGSPVEDWIIL